MNNNTGIHNGAVTHHHDQSITLVNFRVKNNRNSIVPNPIPPELDDFAIIIYLNYCNRTPKPNVTPENVS